jgi:D-glycero-alpha-D-manno-heptose-7-phosphate kinase
MIIVKTPLRISFFGGGTDYPEWFNKNGGEVISTTIDKYSFLCIREIKNVNSFVAPFYRKKFRISYSKVELVDRISSIEHPAVKELLKYFNIKTGLDINYLSDLPSRSGMGSSSNFIVSLISGLNKLKKNKTYKPIELSKKSIFVERNLVKDYVGFQDQIICAYGGLRNIIFKKKNRFIVKKLKLNIDRKRRLNDNLMLFFTGVQRNSTNFASEHMKNINFNYNLLNELGQITKEAKKILIGEKNIDIFGDLLHENWRIKRSLTKHVSNSKIDEIYKSAYSNGASGGKILGAGGGGFILFYVKKKYRYKVLNALKKLTYVPFKFEDSGSKIIY